MVERIHPNQPIAPVDNVLRTYVRRGSSRSRREKSPCKGKPCPSNGLKGSGYIARHHPNRQLPRRDRTTPHRHDTEKRNPRIIEQPNTNSSNVWDKSPSGTANADTSAERPEPAKHSIKATYKQGRLLVSSLPTSSFG